jgi:hypothetical protein
MNDGYQPDPAVEPLKSALGYLTEMVRLDDRAVERVADYEFVNGQHFVLRQHDLHHLPGITYGGFGDDGAIWLTIERLGRADAPTVDADLGPWIEVPIDPDQRPRPSDSIVLDVELGEKERLIAAREARPENCALAANDEAGGDIWRVRLVLEDCPDVAERLRGFIDGPWTSWAQVEAPRRKTIALYERLLEIAALGAGQTFELVWGIGVSRWKHEDLGIDFPVVERLVELEVVEKAEGAEVRIRPRSIGAIVNLKPFEPVSPGGTRLALDSARRILEAIENDGELSPFVRDSFEPILNVVCSQLDPQGSYWADQDAPQSACPDVGKNLVVSDRWVIFARPRSDSFILRDIDRLKDAIDRTGNSAEGLVGAARALVLSPDDDDRAHGRQALVNAIGRPIEIPVAAGEGSEDHGDLFFPLPFDDDQIEIVRRLEKADGLVVQCAPDSDNTQAIANVICHYLGLGLRVLVVSHKPETLATLRDALPSAIRELALGLTSTDKEGLSRTESVVRRIQSIVEALKPREQVTLINKLELDVIATRRRIADVDDEIADMAFRDLQLFPERTELPFDLAKALVAAENAESWFEDRPPKFLAETDLSVEVVDAARDARIRVGDDLQYIHDRLPALAELPEAPTLGRLHNELRETRWLSSAEAEETRFARCAIADLGLEGARQLVADLESLAAGYRAVAEEGWLTSLFPMGKPGRRDEAAVRALVDFAREASSHLARRAAFLARPVGTSTDAIVNKELIEIVARLAEGKKVFTVFAFRDKRLKPEVDSITVAGFAPATADEWAHVRDYLAWRQDIRALVERWRSLALELLAPAIDEDYPRAIHGLEWIVRLVDIGISATGNARRNVAAVASKLSMGRGDIEAMIADERKLQLFGAAVRLAVSRLEALRGKLDRLEGLLSGVKVLSASVRQDLWSRIGSDEITAEQVEAQWTKLREGIQLLLGRRADFTVILKISKKIAEAGAPLLAQRMRTQPADPETGDLVLPANWAMAWNGGALIRRLDNPHLRERLRNLAEQRQRCELRLRELFEALVAARAHLGLTQSLTGAVKQALTAFTIAMRKMEITSSSPIGNRHRRVAREALEGCYDGIPCWIMPSWRVAEQLPAKLGGFDLAIIDGASQCDVRELTIVLRGRKILIIGDDKPVGPVATGIANDKIDWLEHNCLRTVPKTIRPFLLPGSSLCDLAKVVFPDAFIMQLTKKPAPGAPAAAVEETPTNVFVVDDDALRYELPGDRAEESLYPGVGTEAPALTSPGEAIDLNAIVAPLGGDDRDEPTVPRAFKPLIAVPTGSSHREPREQLLPVRPAEDAPSPFIASAATIRNTPWHALVARRGLAVAAGFVIAFAFVGTVYVLLGLNRNFQAGSQASPTLQSTVSAQAAISDPAASASQSKMSDRIPQSTPQNTPLFTPLNTPQNTQQSPQSGQTDGAGAGGIVTQRAVLFEEDPSDPKGGSRLSGSVNWHSESSASAAGGAGILVKAEVEIPDRRLTLTMSLRRNTDHAMPASHVLEFRFAMPSDSPYGGVGKMVSIQMKQQLEQIRGAVLAGMVAKVTSGYFLVGLSATDFELRRNLSMLKERSWIEIPFVYANGTRAILDVEKGTPGERALSEAFVAWGE